MTEDLMDSQITIAAELVSAYVSRNSVPAAELPSLLRSVHGALVGLSPSDIFPVSTP